jgi:hypothetical protein
MRRALGRRSTSGAHTLIAEDVYGIGACLIRLLAGAPFWAPGWILPDDYVTACNPDVPIDLSRVLIGIG